MIFRTILGLFSVLIVCSCNQQPSKSGLQIEDGPNQHLKPQTGLKIENGINRGTGYTDSLGTNYNLRYMSVTITNNNTIPIHLQIAFSKEYDYPSPYSDEQFKVIPLPIEWALDGVEITDSMINELPKYIDKPSVNKTLEPGEEFVAAIGTRYRPTGRGIVPNVLFEQSDSASFQACDSQINPDKSTNSQSALGLKLDIYLTGHRDPSACILIPCGQISYPER